MELAAVRVRKAISPIAGVNRRRFADYAQGIRAAIYGLWSGQLDLFDAMDSMVGTLERGLRQAWYEGAAQCGIKPAELTLDELDAMRFLINSNFNYVMGLMNDIQAGSKANKGKLRPFIQRGQLWINLYNQASNQARQMACKDSKLRWELGNTIQHCGSCLKLNGRVYRASVWSKYGIRPQHPSLICGGWRCLCVLIPTNEPATPGYPPGLP